LPIDVRPLRAAPPPLPLDVFKPKPRPVVQRPRLITPPPLPLDTEPTLQRAGAGQEGLKALNRRVAPRRPIRIPVDLIPMLDPARGLQIGKARRGLAIDLSAEGLLLAHCDYLPLGSVVRLFVRLPDRPRAPMATDARVVRWEWRGQAGYGLKFLDPDPSDIGRIQRLTATAAG